MVTNVKMGMLYGSGRGIYICVWYTVLTSTSQEGHSGFTEDTEKSNKNDQRDEVAVFWGETKKARTLQCGETKAEECCDQRY